MTSGKSASLASWDLQCGFFRQLKSDIEILPYFSAASYLRKDQRMTPIVLGEPFKIISGNYRIQELS